MTEEFYYTLDDGTEVIVSYEFHKGDPEQWYSQNGDPGTPGTGDTIEILNVADDSGNELYDELSKDELERIEARAYELLE